MLKLNLDNIVDCAGFTGHDPRGRTDFSKHCVGLCWEAEDLSVQGLFDKVKFGGMGFYGTGGVSHQNISMCGLFMLLS